MVSWADILIMTSQEKPAYALALHGGAAVLAKSEMTAEREADYRSGLTAALTVGHDILAKGGSALDAVESVVVSLEDNPLFNAGKGASLNVEGHAVLDAAIMDGASLRAGAVALLRHVRNPMKLARCLLEESCHVFLAGEGAEEFAKARGLELVPVDYFLTDYRIKHLQLVKAHLAALGAQGTQANPAPIVMEEPAFGTVGAVALDHNGNLAAATSTGGMTNKHGGRVGDTPVIGAGTYANNETCAVSASGHGEWFIRAVLAYDIAARMAYGGRSIAEAAEAALIERLTTLGGGGGLIAIDKRGHIVMPFNTLGMYRASIRAGEAARVEIY
jgi:beta-aspartyl-peptidase (threonine type)